VLCRLEHPNIIRFIGVVKQDEVNKDPVSILLELAPGGDLEDLYTDRNEALPWDDRVRRLLQGVAQGMAYLAQRDIVHRDLKALNVLLFPGDLPKIADFGIARKRENFAAAEGTLIFIAPEVLNGDEPSEQSDVFSFAMLMYELLFRTFPYTHSSEAKDAFNWKRVIAGTRPRVEAKEMMVSDDAAATLDERGSHWLLVLMQKCWHHTPERRPNFMQISNTLTRHAFSA